MPGWQDTGDAGWGLTRRPKRRHLKPAAADQEESDEEGWVPWSEATGQAPEVRVSCSLARAAAGGSVRA